LLQEYDNGVNHDKVLSGEGVFSGVFGILFLLVNIDKTGNVKPDTASGETGRKNHPMVTPDMNSGCSVVNHTLVCFGYRSWVGLHPVFIVVALYNQWINTHSCVGLEDGQQPPAGCQGLYLYFIGSSPAEKQIEVDLPPAEVDIMLSGCSPIPPENLCPTIPSMHFEGVEPLPNEYITAIHVKYNDVENVYQGNTADVPLRPTPLAGTTIQFWAVRVSFRAQFSLQDQGH
jgi:hypothetical protein